jgi:hypothetical protein
MLDVRSVTLLIASWLALPLAAQDEVRSQIVQLLREKDDAKPELVTTIAAAGTREAAEGLLQAFDRCITLLMRREIVRALQRFTTVEAAAEPVLAKLAKLAGDTAIEAELRAAAIAGLANSPTLGKSLLQRLVDAEIPDPLREAALRAHLPLATTEDAAWYRRVWNLKEEQRKTAAGVVQAPELNTIRQLAAQGAMPFLAEGELIEAMRRESDPKIRRALLLQMQRQQLPRAIEMAEWLLDRVDVPGADRMIAARILLDRDPAKAAGKFIELAKKREVTSEDLRVAMAEGLASTTDAEVQKRLAKLLGKGKPHEKVFALLANARAADPKVHVQLRKALGDSDGEVRRAAAGVAASRGDRDSVPVLRTWLAGKDEGDLRAAFDALLVLEANDESFRKQLAGYVAHADVAVRNAAIAAIGAGRDGRQFDAIAGALAHADWSTRFVAIATMQQLRDKRAVPLLIARMSEETERLRDRLVEALWQLTAQPFEQEAQRWQQWWEAAGPKFAVATEQEVDKAAAERDRRRLTARTAVQAPPKFFGLEIDTQRVMFIVDVSGSMLEAMQGRTFDGRPAARIDVARAELKGAIERLQPGTLFNVLAFSSGVERWLRSGIGISSAPDRTAAIEWVDRLGANGGTNLYDALALAFDDPDVDTIFVMSDGEPTAGELIDGHRIREDIALRNKHRRVAIHTIAVGGNLEVLEWLAKDAGGTYLQIR